MEHPGLLKRGNGIPTRRQIKPSCSSGVWLCCQFDSQSFLWYIYALSFASATTWLEGDRRLSRINDGDAALMLSLIENAHIYHPEARPDVALDHDSILSLSRDLP